MAYCGSPEQAASTPPGIPHTRQGLIVGENRTGEISYRIPRSEVSVTRQQPAYTARAPPFHPSRSPDAGPSIYNCQRTTTVRSAFGDPCGCILIPDGEALDAMILSYRRPTDWMTDIRPENTSSHQTQDLFSSLVDKNYHLRSFTPLWKLTTPRPIVECLLTLSPANSS